MGPSNVFVCLMGLGTVFFGLICLIALTYLMSAVCGKPAVVVPTAAAAAVPEPDRQELAAAVSAALAEELGADVTGIRILSMRKL